MPDDVMTVQQVAELFGVHQETVRNWLRSGALPGVHVGLRWFVRRADVMEMFEAKGGDVGVSGERSEGGAASSGGGHKGAAGASASGASVGYRVIG